MTLAPVLPHQRHEVAEIGRWHIGQCVGPVFEHALVDALRLFEVGAAIGRDAAVENVVVAAQRYLETDASEDSRPILERLGFVAVTTTTPYIWSPPA